MSISHLIKTFHEGTNYEAYQIFGAHYHVDGTIFRLFAPHALNVSVVGEFNQWDKQINSMVKVTNSGVWEVTIKGLTPYQTYKYAIQTKDLKWLLKADPYAFHSELRPATASKIYDPSGYIFNDQKWLDKRKNTLEQPVNIYEVNLGTWRQYKNGAYFDYKKLAYELGKYAKKMGYTHIEIMPIAEYPFDGSWGYQITGFYSITARFGTPNDFKAFVDILHQQNIGVIVDWVPGHFCKDDHGLRLFDGQPLYEPTEILHQEHKSWGTCTFDYGRPEVLSFLISNANFLLKEFHIDGLRVDAVSSMLYLDYGRPHGEWKQNCEGHNINLEARAFLKLLNDHVHTEFEGIMMIAEESTAYPKMTESTINGGLGFDFKWNMGWMNDTLAYIKTDPYFRQYHHHRLTFQLTYVFSEKYVLPLSHDEVVHGKCSLINKMPGDYEQKFAGLKTYMMYMMSHPGKKLTFMGTEFAQFIEWNDHQQLDWLLLDYPKHHLHQQFIKKLNHLYKKEKALYEIENSWDGFKWLNPDDQSHNVLSYYRMDKKQNPFIVIINFSFSNWDHYRIDLPNGCYQVVMASSDEQYGGTTQLEQQKYEVTKGYLEINLPANAGIYLRREKKNV